MLQGKSIHECCLNFRHNAGQSLDRQHRNRKSIGTAGFFNLYSSYLTSRQKSNSLFFFAKPSPDLDSPAAFLQKAAEEYNQKPPHTLNTLSRFFIRKLTPNKVLEGKVPDKKWLTSVIAQAKATRFADNKKQDCLVCEKLEKQV